MRTLLMLATAALLLSPGDARAQAPRGAEPVVGAESAVVTYTVTGRLSGGNMAEPLAVPVDLLERLSREPSLARMEVTPGPGTTYGVLVATFSFTSERAFRDWYASPAGREVARLLADRLREAMPSLSFLRPSIHVPLSGAN